jgi:hypothetical protein
MQSHLFFLICLVMIFVAHSEAAPTVGKSSVASGQLAHSEFPGFIVLLSV